MGLFKVIYYTLFTTASLFLFLNHAPNLLDIDPQTYTTKLLKFEGALAVNKELDKAEIILENQVFAPESLAMGNGEMYASLANGKIVAIKNDKIDRTVIDTAGRPLGLRFHEGKLYVADFEKGILRVDVQTGKFKLLVSSKEMIEGKAVNHPNDLDIHDGVLYYSVSSTKWTSENIFYGFLEMGNQGRVMKHHLASGKTEVIIDNLNYANGIQVSHDKGSLLVSELLKNRIHRFYLSGPKKGSQELFVELPGEPDNIRPSSNGGYWVPLAFARDASSPDLHDRLGQYPKIRKALARLAHLLGKGLHWINGHLSSPLLSNVAEELSSGTVFLLLRDVNRATVVEVDSDGKIVRSLHSSNPKHTLISQGLEHNGNLYFGELEH